VGDDLPHDLLPQLLEKGKEYGVRDIVPFRVDAIVLGEWVQLKCRYGCNRYNTSWCCPPATPGTETVRRILKDYKWAFLLVGNHSFQEFYSNNSLKRARQVRYWKGAVSLERLVFLKGYYKAFSLVSVCCALCKICAYPDKCLFPQEKRPSVESFSIDVIGTLKNIGLTPSVAKQTKDAVDYYSILLLQ